MRLSDLVRSGSQPRPAGGRALETPPPGATRPAPPPRVPAEPAPAAVPRAGASDPTRIVFENAMERIRQTLLVRAEAPLSFQQAEEAVDSLLDSLQASDALLASFFGPTEPGGNPARRAVNVCILALKMGIELGYAREDLRALGLAALLCDVGTSLVPAEMLDRGSPLSGRDRAVLREHQMEGASQLLKLAPEYPGLAEVIRKRYANRDGPHQPGDRFDEYAAIVHLAEVYKSLVHPRPPRKRTGPLDALKEILRRHRAVFPDRVLKALIRAMSTFPVGSLVRLNTGDAGRVVRRNRDYPLRPVVEILVRRGRRLETPLSLDLAQSPLVHIRESVADEESLG